jgi:hypothetical protein
MIRSMLGEVDKMAVVKPDTMIDGVIMGSKRKMYIKLMDRPVCGKDQI